jgi:hypothetical protein
VRVKGRGAFTPLSARSLHYIARSSVGRGSGAFVDSPYTHRLGAQGHTGFKSMQHLPTRNGFDKFVGFLGGSQGYTSSDRWEDEHPMNTDAHFADPPPSCVPGGDGGNYSGGDNAVYNPNPKWIGQQEHPAATAGLPLPGCDAIKIYTDKTFTCGSAAGTAAPAADPTACCTICDKADAAANSSCSHWTWAPGTATAAATATDTAIAASRAAAGSVTGAAAGGGAGTCTFWPGSCVTHDAKGATSGVKFHPSPGPSPPPPSPDAKCHADTYSSTLYGELALDAVRRHDARVPLFLYLPFQAVHGPYDKVPFWPSSSAAGLSGSTYMGMLWDADVYVGALINLLKSKGMYENALVVYTSDNGGTGDGLNHPLRGEKHTNWDGGMRTAAFVSGGLIPAALRGSSSVVNMHVVDWCVTPLPTHADTAQVYTHSYAH